MKRHTYKLNFQTLQMGKFFQLLPLSYTEVVPGDTISGTIQTRLISDTSKFPNMTRTYFDTFAVYCPFRLLWDGWPEFIAGNGGTIPTVTTKFPENFETNFILGGDDLTGGTENLCWYRYLYNLVYNQFIRQEGFPERAENADTVAGVFMRPSTFMESLKTAADTPETDITGDTTVSDLRESFAKDRFDKTRQYYGSKYTDYLAALGVQANWSILEEPEIIGRKHADLPFRMISATTDIAAVTPTGEEEATNVGDPAGYFDGVNTLNLRRTFCPEHGIIGVFAVPRMDTLNIKQGGYPLQCKVDFRDYYSPEYLTERTQEWPNRITGGAVLETASDYRTPIYADLRKGCHMVAGDPNALLAPYFATFSGGTATNLSYLSRSPNEIANDFQGRLATGLAQYQLTSVHRLQRNSPVRPDNSSHGVA